MKLVGDLASFLRTARLTELSCCECHQRMRGRAVRWHVLSKYRILLWRLLSELLLFFKVAFASAMYGSLVATKAPSCASTFAYLHVRMFWRRDGLPLRTARWDREGVLSDGTHGEPSSVVACFASPPFLDTICGECGQRGDLMTRFVPWTVFFNSSSTLVQWVFCLWMGCEIKVVIMGNNDIQGLETLVVGTLDLFV